MTCFDVGRGLLLLGTATGSLYYYSKPQAAAAADACLQATFPPQCLPSPLSSRPLALPPPSFLRLLTLELPSSSASVRHVQLHPTLPHVVAVATASCLLVLDCRPWQPKQPERVLLRWDSSFPISCLAWAVDEGGGAGGSRRATLYSGDEGGVISRSSLHIAAAAGGSEAAVAASGPAGSQSSSHAVDALLFHRSVTESWLRVESAVLQLTVAGALSPPLLLVSTLQRCFLLPLTQQKPALTAIGSKPRKEPYGICLEPAAASSATTAATVLCSRPGKRIWRASLDGRVQATLIVAPPLPSSLSPQASLRPCPLPAGLQPLPALNFSCLLPFYGCVLSWATGCPQLLLLDVGQVEVTDCFLCFGRVLDVRMETSASREAFVLHEQEAAAGAGEDCGPELSVLVAASPYSQLQSLLSAASSPAAAAPPLASLLRFAVKHKVFDRGMLTALQGLLQQRSRGEAEQPDEEELRLFSSLVMEAERAERLGRTEQYWDDSAAAASSPAPAPALAAADAVSATAAAASPAASSSSSRHKLSSYHPALLLRHLTQPQREQERERDGPAAAARAPSPPRPATANPFALSPAAPPSFPATQPAPALALPAAAAAPPSSSSLLPPSLPAAGASASEQDVFARASLLPADNLPFAEPLMEAGLQQRQQEQREGATITATSTAETAADRRRRRLVRVAVGGEAEQQGQQRDSRARDRRQERLRAKRRKDRSREKAPSLPALASVGDEKPQTDSSTGEAAAQDGTAATEQQQPAVRPGLGSAEAEQQQEEQPAAWEGDGAEAAASSDEQQQQGDDDQEAEAQQPQVQQPGSQAADCRPREQEGDDEQGAAQDDDVISLMLRPSSRSLLSPLGADSALLSLRPVLLQLRVSLAVASRLCGRQARCWTLLETEEAAASRAERWQAACTRSALSRQLQSASLAETVEQWQLQFEQSLLCCPALEPQQEEEEEETTTATALDARLARLCRLLASFPPLLRQELAALLSLRLHLLLLQPAGCESELLPFLSRYRSCLQPLTTFSLLRLYQQPLCLRLHHVLADEPPRAAAVAAASASASAVQLPADPLELAARLPSLLSAPNASAGLLRHLTACWPHVSAWMLRHCLGLQQPQLDSASPLPLAAALHPDLPSALSSQPQPAAVSGTEWKLNAYRAFLHALLFPSSSSPPPAETVAAATRRQPRLLRHWLCLSLRIQGPAAGPGQAAQAGQWPFQPSLLAVLSSPSSFPSMTVAELLELTRAFGFHAGLLQLQCGRLQSQPSLELFASALSLALELDEEQAARRVLALLQSAALPSLSLRFRYAEAAMDAYGQRAADRRRQQPAVSLRLVLHSLLLALGPPLLLQLLLSIAASATSPARALLSGISPLLYGQMLQHSHSLLALSRCVLSLMETVDSYRWTQRPQGLATQLTAAQQAEEEERWTRLITQDDGDAAASLSPSASGSLDWKLAAFSRSAVWRLWAEDGGCVDWGRRLRTLGAVCACCGSGLEWRSSSAGRERAAADSGEDGSSSGSSACIAFDCPSTHLCHRQCAPQLACTRCLHDSMSGVLQS